MMNRILQIALMTAVAVSAGASITQMTRPQQFSPCTGLSCSPSNDVCDQTIGCLCGGTTCRTAP
jgi:uncharacterized membrane protein